MSTRIVLRVCALLAACLLAMPSASAQLIGPGAPPNLAASASAPGAISLSWEPASSIAGVTSYRVYHVEADGNLTLVGETAPDALAYTETDLTPGTTVTYVVKAVDLLGEGPASDAASATTWSVPSAPVGVTATSGPGPVGEASVSWSAPESDGGTPVLAYNVYRDGALVAALDASATSYTETGLTPFHAHSYHVSATNAVGEGASSDAACGMPSPWVAELGCTAASEASEDADLSADTSSTSVL